VAERCEYRASAGVSNRRHDDQPAPERSGSGEQQCLGGSVIVQREQELSAADRIVERLCPLPRALGCARAISNRIWVSLILDLLADGASFDEILANYPGLTREDIQACIAYGSEMARERCVPIPIEDVA
jgi:uncharacterized protein (DUF433 family)